MFVPMLMQPLVCQPRSSDLKCLGVMLCWHGRDEAHLLATNGGWARLFSPLTGRAVSSLCFRPQQTESCNEQCNRSTCN